LATEINGEVAMKQHGGSHPGAGRKPGYRLRRTATEVPADLGERFSGWSPLLLAEIANDGTKELPLRLAAAKTLAVYVHPKPKPVVLDPDALVEVAGRLAFHQRRPARRREGIGRAYGRPRRSSRIRPSNMDRPFSLPQPRQSNANALISPT
jgi:hypothetical protein